MELSIFRINYKDYKTELDGFYSLPTLHNLNEINDINEVKNISIYFDTIEEANIFISKSPKSFKLKMSTCGCSQNGNYITKYGISINFNTFWMNNKTGKLNESAYNKRIKFLGFLKALSLFN